MSLCCAKEEMQVFAFGKVVKVFFANVCNGFFFIPFMSGQAVPVKLSRFPVFNHHVAFSPLIIFESEPKFVR